MKKILALLAATLLATSAFAQDDNVIVSSKDGVVSLETVSHFGWGYHFVKSDDFKRAGAGQFFINLLNLDIRPAEVFGLGLGVDAKFDYFASKKDSFYLDGDKKIQAMPFAEGYDKTRSEINVTSLSFPLLAKVYFGDWHVSLGAEADLNLWGHTYNFTKEANVRTRVTERKAKLETFSYGLIAAIQHNDFGIFCKYYPKSSKILPDGSVDFSYCTLGLAIGL